MERVLLSGIQTVIVDCQTDVDAVALADDVESLWLTPTSGSLTFESPLHCPKLKWLYVKRCEQPILEMVDRESLSCVQTLLIVDSAGASAGIGRLGELPRLDSLMIRQQQLQDDSCNWVCQQQRLRSLALTDTNVTDTVISQLRCKQSLRRIDLWRSNVTFSHLAMRDVVFPAVRSVDVSGTEVSSASVDIIRVMFPRLERLLAAQTQLTLSDVKTIAAWDGLKILDTGTPDVDFDLHGDPFWDL